MLITLQMGEDKSYFCKFLFNDTLSLSIQAAITDYYTLCGL